MKWSKITCYEDFRIGEEIHIITAGTRAVSLGHLRSEDELIIVAHDSFLGVLLRIYKLCDRWFKDFK